MKWIYMACLGLIVLVMAYFAGERAGGIKCRNATTQNVSAQQAELIEIQRKNDEDAVNRGVGDIRRILREKYTIAQ